MENSAAMMQSEIGETAPDVQREASEEAPREETPNNNDYYNDDKKSVSCLHPLIACWKRFTQFLHYGISQFVLTLSLLAARNPKRCIVLVIIVSFTLLITGLFTGFYIDVNEEEMFAPQNAPSRAYVEYIRNLEGFPPPARLAIFIVHAEGESIVGYEAMDRLFQAVDAARDLDDYNDVCAESGFKGYNGEDTCRLIGPTRFWYNNATLFREQVNFAVENNFYKTKDEAVQAIMSLETFPDGSPAFQEMLMGQVEWDYGASSINSINSTDSINGTTGTKTLASATALFLLMELPPVGDKNQDTLELEAQMNDVLVTLRDDIRNTPGKDIRLEFITQLSLPQELFRAIAEDMPLLPFVAIIMTAFTCFVFFRWDKVKSRTSLGFGAAATISLAIMSGYGIMFIAGVPFTNMTLILPFVIFGVGLDDVFIITGAYFRVDPNKDTVDRVRETMEEVGNSISLTTITTTVAFCLGWASSTIPSIQWLCIYAFPTIFIDFIYQITFFVAIIVLDEKRIKDNRRDCCIWITTTPSPATDDNAFSSADVDGAVAVSSGLAPAQSSIQVSGDAKDGSPETELSQGKQQLSPAKADVPLADRLMEQYATQLLRPPVKVFVLLVFAAFLGGCAYSATLLKQDFKASDFLPVGSYAADYLYAQDMYFKQPLRVPAYFRYVDQSSDDVQDEMLSYISDLVALPQFQREPEYCWVRDFKALREGKIPAYAEYTSVLNNNNLTFNQQVELALSVPEISIAYGSDIARDEDGNIEASRCFLSVTNVDLNDVESQLAFMAAMDNTNAAQPVNAARDKNDPAFFPFEKIFFLWEFYTVAANELKYTTISGVVAISIIGLILIPHWTASCFVTPMIVILYVDLLGTIQFAGLHINPLTYVCLVISIGLLVDFLMHILLRYYESTEPTRDAKVKDTLRTMGSSILVGGLSTCLGVVPLAFSSAQVLKTVFISFTVMVTLGLAHGLILLPVLLSYLGPTVCVRLNHQELRKQLHLGHGEDNSARGEDEDEEQNDAGTWHKEVNVDEVIANASTSTSPAAKGNGSDMEKSKLVTKAVE